MRVGGSSERRNGDPGGTRTRVARMKTWSPRPLDDGAVTTGQGSYLPAVVKSSSLHMGVGCGEVFLLWARNFLLTPCHSTVKDGYLAIASNTNGLRGLSKHTVCTRVNQPLMWELHHRSSIVSGFAPSNCLYADGPQCGEFRPGCSATFAPATCRGCGRRWP